MWAASCPENFLHKKLLIEAELARLDGQLGDSLKLYEQAIDEAREHGFVHNEAMAHLLAGKYSASMKAGDQPPRPTCRAPRDLYARWGAESRVLDLEATYPSLHSGSDEGQVSGDPGSTSVRLDATTLVKATRAISGELRLESLFDKMMEIMVESAGAQHGYLFPDNEHEENGEHELVARAPQPRRCGARPRPHPDPRAGP